MPEALQHPILKEITPIKTLFLLQRPPASSSWDPTAQAKPNCSRALFGDDVLLPGEENLNDSRWQTIGRAGRGHLRLLDARRPASQNPPLQEELARETPDLFIFVRTAGDIDDALAADLDHATQLLSLVTPNGSVAPKLLGCSCPPVPVTPRPPRRELHAALHKRPN